MNETRRVYYNQFIEDNSTDQRRLFAASRGLLNMKKDRSLPHIRFHSLQTIWVSFFIAKITNIRSKLNGILAVNVRAQPGIWIWWYCIFPLPMPSLTEKFVIWLHLEKPNLASSCLDSLLPAITNMVNLSLQTRYFAETWNPSLKKPGLDLLFKNFRLIISNLQIVTWLQIISSLNCNLLK